MEKITKTFVMEIMTKSNPKYKIGESVYLTHDPNQFQRQIVAITYYATFFQYILQCGIESSQHFEYEMTNEQNILFNLN